MRLFAKHFVILRLKQPRNQATPQHNANFDSPLRAVERSLLHLVSADFAYKSNNKRAKMQIK